LDKIREVYLKAYPYVVLYRDDMTSDEMRRAYGHYDPRPSKLKALTDSSFALAKELREINVNKSLLKIRERRMLALAKHFLDHQFGSPYKDNYYAGNFEGVFVVVDISSVAQKGQAKNLYSFNYQQKCTEQINFNLKNTNS
jgi:hypothetical protein